MDEKRKKNAWWRDKVKRAVRLKKRMKSVEIFFEANDTEGKEVVILFSVKKRVEEVTEERKRRGD